MRRAVSTTLFGVALLLLTLGCTDKKEEEWINLFNGKDLEGWVPKITGYPTGENYGNTFRVEDGLLTVSYDKYYRFDNRFGHLFYEKPFSNYLLRIEYRFIGEQVEGGAQWALKNSGVMLHSQDPYTMGEQQDFPISLEAQFLGGLGDGPRPTGNLCTPGTHVEINGELIETHCIDAVAPTYNGEEWVTMDILVRGDQEIAHIIDGDTLIKYQHPVVGGDVVNNILPEAKKDGQALKSGYIALQSESHPIQFRKVMIKELNN
ncbi:3-keto-disaccharide hydrolase [Roseivirga sp.]|uniref:3-keto-disaccharide hydrolase n=1 Tax=Roseivirga sp. TaxID=1964215 RepID=UPI003B5199CE